MYTTTVPLIWCEIIAGSQSTHSFVSPSIKHNNPSFPGRYTKMAHWRLRAIAALCRFQDGNKPTLLIHQCPHSTKWKGYRLNSKNETVSHEHQYTQQVTSLLHTMVLPQKQHKTGYQFYLNKLVLWHCSSTLETNNNVLNQPSTHTSQIARRTGYLTIRLSRLLIERIQQGPLI